MTIRIATWNVNSIKSRIVHLQEWLRKDAPDIVLLQELKTTSDTFPYMEIEELGYNVAVQGQKTYNGVAILSKLPLSDVTSVLPGDSNDMEARYIEAVASGTGFALRVASVYVPNGQSPDSDKFQYKLRFFQRLESHIKHLLPLDEVLVIGGDYNVAPMAIDVYDPNGLDGTTCFHPLERQAFHTIEHLGVYDAFRIAHPGKQSFSWWDYRGNGFEAGKGMRIDHLMLSPQAADKLVTSEIEQSLRRLDKPSDHTPVICTLDLNNG
jgi:exodeoxyribonuclease-3